MRGSASGEEGSSTGRLSRQYQPSIARSTSAVRTKSSLEGAEEGAGMLQAQRSSS